MSPASENARRSGRISNGLSCFGCRPESAFLSTGSAMLASWRFDQPLDAVSYDVDWRSYQESYLDRRGPFNDVVVSLMATLAKQERRISEPHEGGPTARQTRRKEPRKAKGRCKRQLARKLRKDGLSLRQIAARTKLSLSTVVRSLAAAPA